MSKRGRGELAFFSRIVVMCTSFFFCFTPFLPQSIRIRFVNREEVLVPI